MSIDVQFEVDLAPFRAYARESGVERHAPRWSSLAQCAQERLVYEAALDSAERGGRYLDWGCGDGHLSHFLERHGHVVDAFSLDDAPPLLEAHSAVRFSRGRERTALPWPDATFDGVFAVGVLEHVAEDGGDLRGSLRELARVVKPDGRLFVFHLPNRHAWMEHVTTLAHAIRLTSATPHRHRFTRAAFSALIDPSWTVERAGRYHILPRVMLARLPFLADSPRSCRAIDRIDDALARVFAPFAQNWYFILRKEG